MLETSCREKSDEIYKFLVMTTENLALVVKNHRRHGFTVEWLPLRQALGIRVAGTRKIRPATAHFCSKFNSFLCTSSHACMHSSIIEYERNLHAMRTAKDAIHDRRLPAEHIDIDRSCTLTALQGSLFKNARSEGEVRIYKIKRLMPRIGFCKEFYKTICLLSIGSPYEIYCIFPGDGAQCRDVGRCGELMKGGSHQERNVS